MEETEGFESWLKARLESIELQRKQAVEHTRTRMHELDQRRERFDQVARPLIETAIRPRVELVAGAFENASILEPGAHGGWSHVACVFRHTDRFPATTKLDFWVCPDGDIRHLLLCYRLKILPMFFQFDGEDQCALPLDQVRERDATLWMDAKLRYFVETYLRLEQADVYQRENMVRDPVCGMPVNKHCAAARLTHNGTEYFFCLEECQRKFASNPERYCQARS